MAFQKEYCEQVRRYVADHHMEDIVTVKTNVPRREMEAEYLAADVYVIPSTRDPFDHHDLPVAKTHHALFGVQKLVDRLVDRVYLWETERI